MNGERPSLSDILRTWKTENGERRSKQDGEEYLIIKASLSNLRDLAKTMLDSGYTYAEMSSPAVGARIGQTCWRDDKIVKMTNAAISKAQKEVALDWLEAIAPYSGITISKADPIENPIYVKPEPKKPEVKIPQLDIVPKDRIILDTSDMVEPDFDLDFLQEIGVDKSFVSGEKDE